MTIVAPAIRPGSLPIRRRDKSRPRSRPPNPVLVHALVHFLANPNSQSIGRPSSITQALKIADAI